MASCTAAPTIDIATVGMGQIAVAQAPACLTAVLGSCVGVVLHHPRTQWGALAHVVLPDSGGRASAPGKFADTAVSEMLRLLEKHQVRPAGLIAKLAGGAQMFATGGPMQIGEANIKAVTEALRRQAIRVAAQDVGGTHGRRISLDCSTGTVTVEAAGKPPRTL